MVGRGWGKVRENIDDHHGIFDRGEDGQRPTALETGGGYFREHNTREREEIYQLIDTLEPVEQDAQMFRSQAALFHWPLGSALCVAAVLVIGRVLGRYEV